MLISPLHSIFITVILVPTMIFFFCHYTVPCKIFLKGVCASTPPSCHQSFSTVHLEWSFKNTKLIAHFLFYLNSSIFFQSLNIAFGSRVVQDHTALNPGLHKFLCSFTNIWIAFTFTNVMLPHQSHINSVSFFKRDLSGIAVYVSFP